MCQCERQSNAWPSSPLYRTVGFTRIAWLLQQNWWISAALPLNTAHGPAAIARGLSGARDCFWLVIECPINNNHSNQCLFSVPWLRMLERGHLKEQWVIECPIISNYSATGFRTVPVYIRHSTFQQFESVNHMIMNIISRTRARCIITCTNISYIIWRGQWKKGISHILVLLRKQAFKYGHTLLPVSLFWSNKTF